MADNALKVPFARSLNRVTAKRINDFAQLLGKALTVTVKEVYGNTNTIVTVQFNVKSKNPLPLVTMPVFGSEYIRLPIQPGDQGITVPADVLLGGITGLGSGQPILGLAPANLQGLVFLPIGNNGFSDTDDKQKLVLYGPNGAVLRDVANENSVVVQNSDGSVTVTGKTKIKLQVTGGPSIEMGPGNAVNINSNGGTVTIDGIAWNTHAHGGVQTGGGNTLGPH